MYDASQRTEAAKKTAAKRIQHPGCRKKQKKQQLNSGTIIRVISLLGMVAVLVIMMMLRKF